MKYGAALFLLIILALGAAAQDTSQVKKDPVLPGKDTSLFVKGRLDTVPKKSDTLIRQKHSPRKAAIRSAIIPGWGQVYNKKYWKVPIVYTALGIPAYLFFDNLRWYDRAKYAYLVTITHTSNPDSLRKVHPQLLPFVQFGQSTSLLNYRNEFRRNVDYSALFFLLFWGLNIVDATVDAHLKEFDVSPELSLKVKPGFSPVSNTYGMSLVLDFHKAQPRTLLKQP